MEARGRAIKAYRRVEEMEAKVECLKGVLIKAEVDLALKKGRRKIEATKAKKKLVEAEKKVKEMSTEAGCLAMKAYKASLIFLWRRLKWWRPSKYQRNSTMTNQVQCGSLFTKVTSWA